MKMDVSNLSFGQVEDLIGRLERFGTEIRLRRTGERLELLA